MAVSEVTSQEFEPYTLSGILVTDLELGQGSYASVVEIDYRGLKCAGKKIFSKQRDSLKYLLHRFVEECRLLSQLRHPNMVQFLGVHFEDQVTIPILVMEYLPTNLSSCIDKYGILPDDINYSILHDVSLGLSYLHNQTPPIIHQDLSANNVLLTSNMTAKISDLSVAKILNLTPLQMSHLTETPGTPTYMPPEVMVADPKYNTSVDVFSYGIMMIHVFAGKWPHPKVGPTRLGSAGQLIPVLEAERREEYLRDIGYCHPLMDLILRCINNDIKWRGCVSEIVQRLKEAMVHFPPSFTNKIEMLSRIKALQEEKRELIADSEQNIEKQVQDMKEEIEVLKKNHQDIVIQLQDANSDEVEQLESQLRDLNIEQTGLKQNFLEHEEAINNFEDIYKTQKTAMSEKDDEIITLNNQLTKIQEYLSFKPQPIKVNINWKQCADLPVTASGGQTTVLDNKVYYGGFCTDKNDEDACTVLCYDPSQDTWSTLPPLPVQWFGLGQVKGHLVTVGGQTKYYLEDSKDVYVFDMKSKTWNQPLPPMPFARYSPAVASLSSALVVAGGSCTYACINNVEIFDADTSVWLTANLNNLPTSCQGMSAQISTGVCYLYIVGGYDESAKLNQLICAPIDGLLRNAMPYNQAVQTQPLNLTSQLPPPKVTEQTTLPPPPKVTEQTTLPPPPKVTEQTTPPSSSPPLSHSRSPSLSSSDDSDPYEIVNPEPLLEPWHPTVTGPNTCRSHDTADSDSSEDHVPVWHGLLDTPTYNPSAAMVGETLLFIGGQEGPNFKGEPQSVVYMYSSCVDSWIYISDIPAPRANSATAVLLSPLEILVIGGCGVDDDCSRVKTVYKATFSQ